MGKDSKSDKITDGYVVAEAVIPTEDTTKLIKVIAPSDLAAGYQFEAESDGQRYMVTVPEGGVKAGQEFTTRASPAAAAALAVGGGLGSWKTGLCDCFRYGCCHPHLCLSWCCMPIALAQVMTRMRLNFMAERGSVSEVAKTFKTMVGIFVCYVIVDQILASMLIGRLGTIAGEYNVEEYDYTKMEEKIDSTTMFIYYIRRIISLTFSIYIFVALYRTRRSVRAKYNIPAKNSCEDCCCTLCCPCPTTMQLMRQTADYDTYAANCCTETGLPSHVNADDAAPVSNAV